MTLDFLEGTIFEQGPEFWAIMILFSLIMIEFFELGPSRFSSLLERGKKKGRKGLGARKGRLGVAKHASKAFRKSIQKIFFGEKDHALLYLWESKAGVNLRPRPSIPVGAETRSFPDSKDFDNYVMALGEEANITVLTQLPTLWSVKDRSSVDHIVLYMSREPSLYDVQAIADMLQGYRRPTRQVDVSLLYRGLRRGEQAREVDGELEEKEEYLIREGINLDKIKIE